ncbi:UNVERIFIED_ORG: hypothetical protein J2W66_004423 [Agrobacterium larrymoorei]|jgi:hypothetical protein|nr:hypothetical protein [Agrobacterium larrymoorei]
MTHKKTDLTSDAERTGKNAEENREQLIAEAAKGLKKATADIPKKDA